ncbi:MAG: helix-turn-helix domain-containing protein [Hyphomicrobiales bacterium]
MNKLKNFLCFQDYKFQWWNLLVCMPSEQLKGNSKIVGIHITLKYVNGKTNQCWPSIGTIATNLGFSKRTIMRAFAELQNCGLFTVLKQAGPYKTNIYEVSYESLQVAKKLKVEQRKGDKLVTSDAALPIDGVTTETERGANIVNDDGQGCHPNLLNQPNSKKLSQKFGIEILTNAGVVTIPKNSDQGKAWIVYFEGLGIEPPDWMVLGVDKFRVPRRYPENLSPEIEQYFRNLVDK